MRPRIFVALALLTTGCAVGPRYVRPRVDLPPQFYGQEPAAEARSLADAPWWDVFGDAALRGLVDEALQNGYDVRLAAARVEEARARYGVARSNFFPQVDYQGQVQVGRKAGDGDDGKDAEITVGVGASWELDVWGRLRRANEAARAQYLATEEGRRGVLLSLVSDLASSYFELRELDQERAIARRSADAFQEARDLFQRRFEGGAASGLETARAEALLATARAQIPQLERAIVAKEAQIALLLGRAAGPVPRGAALMEQPLAPDVPSGLPAALLERRPDLREVEQQLVAANANVGVAQAALFPTIRLTGLFGGVSTEVSELLGDGRSWSLAGGLTGPLFHGGRLRKEKRIAVAQWEQARIEYERTVTSAFGEVSTSLVAVQKLAEVETERRRALDAQEEAVRLVNLRYSSGYSAYFEVLDALTGRLIAETSLAQSRRDRLISVVRLYQTLGGGWPIGPAAAATAR